MTRIVFKLKTSHFKGARALANAEPQMANNRLTDESMKDDLDSAKKPNCLVECLNVTQESGIVDPSGLLCQEETSEELLVTHWIRKKKAKRANILVVSEKDKKDAAILKLPSCQMQKSSSFDHQWSRAGLDQHESASEEFRGACGVLEEIAMSADEIASRQHVGNGLELVAHRSSCFKFDDECYKQDDDMCGSGTSSEMIKEVKVAEVPENELEIDDKTESKIDIAEEVADCLTTSFVDADAHPKQSRDTVNYQMISVVGPDACSNWSGYNDANEKFDDEAKEDRSLVRALDDAQKNLWLKDAIELMELEPSGGSKVEPSGGSKVVREALLLSKPNLQVHAKLDTSRLLQAYAECRERCIIVYKICTGREDNVEASHQQTHVKMSDLAIERMWSLGGDFYVLLLGSKEAAKEAIFDGAITFQGGKSYAVPYVPCFSPNEGPGRACPVWVTFVHLPIYFRPFLLELAAQLGKVLSAPHGEALEASDSPRVCICWKISKCIPEFLLVDMEGLGSKKLKIEFDSSLLRHLSESIPQKVASTVSVSI